MKIYHVKTCQVYSHHVKKNVLNFWQWGNVLEFLAVAWSYKAFQNFNLYIYLQVNKRSKLKSGPILLLFFVMEEEGELCNSWFFEPALP